MNIGHLIATLGVNTAGLVAAERSMKQFETRMGASVARINKRLETSGAAMKKFGRGMTMYMTAPLALVGGAAFKMHMDFESSMSKIVGLVGVAREQVDAWGKDILKMAPQLAKSPQELADALFFVTSAGLRGAEAMDVLEMSAKASAAGLGETKIVADLVTSAMNAYGTAVLNAEQATDVLVATVREGKAEAAALTASMGMVLPIASNMGVAFHEVGAAVAAMTRTGTKAATASMQLRQILASMLKPTQQAEEALRGMGTSSALLRKTIREDGLLAALMKLKELSDEYGETVMSTVFPNIRALSGVLDIMGANLEDNIALFERMGVTTDSLNKAFEAASETTRFKFDQAIVTAKTSLTILGKTVSEAFLPILKSLAEKLQKLTDWFTSLDDAQRQQVVRIAGLIAVIGPLSMILGVLLGGISRLITIGYGAVKMFNALRLAMMANPILAIAAGITILVAAIIQFTKKKKEATDAQLEFNKALEEEGLLMGDIRSIKARISVLETLNKRQVEDLLRRIGSQIKIEEDYTAKLLAEAKTRVEIEGEAARARELAQRYSVKEWELTEEEKSLFARVSAAGMTKVYQVENMKRLQDLEAYLILAKMKLARFKDESGEIATKITKDWLEITKERRAITPVQVTGIGRFPTPPGEKLAAQAKLVADAWVQAAEAGKLYDTTITTGLVNMETGMERNIIKWEELNRKMAESEGILFEVGMMMEGVAMLGATLVDRQIAKLDEQYRRDIAGAKDNASQKARIEEQYDKKRGDLLRKAAIAEKLAALFSIALSTAKGAADAASKIATIPLIPWIIAHGAIQAAIVAARPVPKFAEGGIVSRPTLAVLGEKGPEAVIPLDKMNQQPIVVNLIGEWKMIGEDMHYIVKEQDRKHSNSF